MTISCCFAYSIRHSPETQTLRRWLISFCPISHPLNTSEVPQILAHVLKITFLTAFPVYWHRKELHQYQGVAKCAHFVLSLSYTLSALAAFGFSQVIGDSSSAVCCTASVLIMTCTCLVLAQLPSPGLSPHIAVIQDPIPKIYCN